MAAISFLLLCIAQIVLAFSDTNSLIAWSSHSSLDHLPTSVGSHDSASLLDSIFLHPEICTYDAVIVIDQPGLHASDLRNLLSTSHVVRSVKESNDSRQYAYVPCSKYHKTSSSSVSPLSVYASSMSERCNSRVSTLSLGHDVSPLDPSEKHTVMLNMPAMRMGAGTDRMNHMSVYDDILSTMLDNLLAASPKSHLIIYTGTTPAVSYTTKRDASQAHALRRRASSSLEDDDDEGEEEIEGGILAKYQLLTPGIILGFLVTFGILLPILTLGVKAIGSIQVPLMNGNGGQASTGYSATEKKNQ